MSSVNSDITKEIEDLLRKKETNPNKLENQLRRKDNNQLERPNSISNAGKESLARQAFSYDGITLSNYFSILDSNNPPRGTLGTDATIDLERINGLNEQRLKQFKMLGVDTIQTNTEQEDDLNNLDRLLDKYK